MIIADCHVHSRFSSDSQAPEGEMAEEALRRGFPLFYLTDHMDYEFPAQEGGMRFLFDPAKYFSSLGALAETLRGKIEVLPSVELGLKPHLADDYRKLLSDFPFDFVIGSTHLVDDEDPYDASFWEGRSEREAMGRYFEAVIENIRAFPEFDSLGHLDYVVRYAPSVRDGRAVGYPYGEYADYIDEALRLVISHGIALEVNTAGYSHGLMGPNPSKDVLRRYRELGGELLTIGSDAHRPALFAHSFASAEALLWELGFRYYAVYKKRKAEMLPLSPSA